MELCREFLILSTLLGKSSRYILTKPPTVPCMKASALLTELLRPNIYIYVVTYGSSGYLW